MQTDNQYQTLVGFGERWHEIGGNWWIAIAALLAVTLIVACNTLDLKKKPKVQSNLTGTAILFSVFAFVVFPIGLLISADNHVIHKNDSIISESISKKYDTSKINDIGEYDRQDKTISAYYVDVENGVRAKIKFAFTSNGEPYLLKDSIAGEDTKITTYDEVSEKIEKAS